MAQSRPLDSVNISLATWARAVTSSSLREMLAMTAHPDILSFALGLPASDLFPTKVYAEAVARVLSDDSRALQYEMPLSSLKTHIVGLMAERGVICSTDQIFLTSGAQQ